MSRYAEETADGIGASRRSTKVVQVDTVIDFAFRNASQTRWSLEHRGGTTRLNRDQSNQEQVMSFD
jgi:hypothetical protein